LNDRQQKFVVKLNTVRISISLANRS